MSGYPRGYARCSCGVHRSPRRDQTGEQLADELNDKAWEKRRAKRAREEANARAKQAREAHKRGEKITPIKMFQITPGVFSTNGESWKRDRMLGAGASILDQP